VPKLASLNIGMVLVWLSLAMLIRRRHAKLTGA
jgi:hypothetical protein